MLRHTIVLIKDLTAEVLEAMYQLMGDYYDNLRKDKFLKDLAEKEGVLLVYESNGTLCGFTTYVIFETVFQNEKINVLYSGDTVIREAYWGQASTAQIFMSLIQRFLSEPSVRFYWFLLSKGLRTYRLLPLYFKEYYPAPRGRTPDYEKNLIVHLCRLKFNSSYRESEGIIRLNPPADRLKKKYLFVRENKLSDPTVPFFIKKNPGYIKGDELPCVARISRDNLSQISRRWLKE